MNTSYQKKTFTLILNGVFGKGYSKFLEKYKTEIVNDVHQNNQHRLYQHNGRECTVNQSTRNWEINPLDWFLWGCRIDIKIVVGIIRQADIVIK